jgi:general secretion pathway protein H
MRERQQGFTLIELMVVVAIVAVLLAAGVMSLGSRDNQQQRQQWTQTQSILQMACDQAAFNQQIYLVSVSAKGLEAFYRQQGEWLPAKMHKVSWREETEVSWQLDETLQEAWALPEQGWLCWPRGVVSEGEIQMQLPTVDSTGSVQVLRWDEGLNFEFED